MYSPRSRKRSRADWSVRRLDGALSGIADPAGSRLVADIVVASCPTTYPSALTVRVDIRDLAASAPSTVITTISTKVVVTGP